MGRQAGVLLHISSLPSGRLDRDAYAFVDWLAEAGLGWWALLPLGPPDKVGSPYSSPSAFATWRGFLANPNAAVSAAEADAFRDRESFWIDSWIDFAGREALADQVRFDREWIALRSYAADRGVKLIGDMPIYVAAESVDFNVFPIYFHQELRSGTEPNARHPHGQYWGHPVYNWNTLREERYRWWVQRFRRNLALYDFLRIDHFRGLANFWAIPEESKDPYDGFWMSGPGKDLFDTAEAELGRLPCYVEEPGDIEEDVEELRDALGFPGIGVLVRGFDDRLISHHRPECIRENQVVYTATHDNDTVVGWYGSLSEAERRRVPVDRAEPHWGLIEIALRSPAHLALIQAQDILGLGSEARMNVPGTVKQSNWRWRLQPGQLGAAEAARLRGLLEATSRVSPAVSTGRAASAPF